MQPNSHPSPLPGKFSERIPKELIHDLPLLAFAGPIQVLTDSKEARRVARRLLDEPVLGFDTETRPAFRKGVEYEVALLQLATREECFLFRHSNWELRPCSTCPALRAQAPRPGPAPSAVEA